MIKDISDISQSYIPSKFNLEPGWTAPANLEKELGTNMKHYKIHQDFFPAQVPKLDRNASRLDMSIASCISLPCKFLESLERQARNVISITCNSYADLFATAAFSSLSSEEMDAIVLRRLTESLVNCITHSTNVSVLMVMALFHARREVAISSSKILSESTEDALRSIPDTLFGGKISELQKSNSESFTQKFIAQSMSTKAKPSTSFKPPSSTSKKPENKKDTRKPQPSLPKDPSRPQHGGSTGGHRPTPSRGGASSSKHQ